MAIDLDYAIHVRRVLLAAGVMGITFRDLNAKVRTPNHPTADLRLLLRQWEKRRWVDNFERYTGQRYSQIWRATQLLFEQWPVVMTTIEALLLAEDLPLEPNPAQTRTADQEPSAHSQ